MSFTDTDPEPLFDSQTGEPIEPGQKEVRDLRAAAARGNKATQENEQLRRELAFVKAGVDTESKAGKLLLKAYDGDISDIAALKAEAEALHALTAPAAPPPAPAPVNAPTFQVPVTPAEAQALAQRGQVASGAPASQLVTDGRDPRAAAQAEFDRVINEGKSKEAARAAAFHVTADAFLKGDPRVQWRDQGQGQMSEEMSNPGVLPLPR